MVETEAMVEDPENVITTARKIIYLHAAREVWKTKMDACYNNSLTGSSNSFCIVSRTKDTSLTKNSTST